MVHHNSQTVDPSSRRPWSLLSVGGLTTLAVLVAAMLGSNPAVALADEAEKKPEPKAAEKPADAKKADKPGRDRADIVRDMARLIRELQQQQAGDNRLIQPFVLQRRELQKLWEDLGDGAPFPFEDLDKLFAQMGAAQFGQGFGLIAPPGGLGNFGGFGGFGNLGGFNQPFMIPGKAAAPSKLGVRVEKPNPALVEQLDLPKDQGLVLTEVGGDSPAAKAGLKTHDILLEVDGKSVPADPLQFARMIGEVKTGEPISAVVLRKGRKETIKDLTLPGPAKAEVAAKGANVENKFTAALQQDGVKITLSGSITDGKTTVKSVTVEDGKSTATYDSLEAVPEKYRNRVKGLLRE